MIDIELSQSIDSLFFGFDIRLGWLDLLGDESDQALFGWVPERVVHADVVAHLKII